MPTPSVPKIAILRPGSFTSTEGVRVSFSHADLAQIASSYNADRDPAPIVVGHPKINDPAFGWIGSLSMEGDTLVAVPSEVAPSFAEAVQAGHYRKVSAQLYQPGDPNSPAPTGWYLRHVGFLGAAAPAIKGLGTVSFAASARAITIAADDEILPFQVPAGYRADAAALQGWERARRVQLREPHLSFAEAVTVAEADAEIAGHRRAMLSLAEGDAKRMREADLLVARARQVQAINPGCTFMEAFYIVRDARGVVSFAEGAADTISGLFKRARALRERNAGLSFRDAYMAAQLEAKAR